MEIEHAYVYLTNYFKCLHQAIQIGDSHFKGSIKVLAFMKYTDGKILQPKILQPKNAQH